MATGNPCVDKLVAQGKISESEAKELVAGLERYAKRRAAKDNGNMAKALQDVSEETLTGEEVLKQIQTRNTMLNVRAARRMMDFVNRPEFKTKGEGIRAFLEGSPKFRNSVDAQAHALHKQLFGELANELDAGGVMKEFRSGKLDLEIFIEMGEIKPGGRPGRSGSPAARKIADILHNQQSFMIRRQNLAGGYIMRLPGYIMRQTHDMSAIRKAGNDGSGPLSKEASLRAWSDFVLPLIDYEKTFKGADVGKFMRGVHEGLYSGTHGPPSGADITYISVYPSVAKKVSTSRVLHFKNAEAAYKYNQEFGLRSLQDSVFSDLFYRARNIAVMENLGPNPEATYRQVMRDLNEQVRTADDADIQSDSLNTDWRVEAAFQTVMGILDNPTNVTLHRRMSSVQNVLQMAKMGGVAITSITDKAFFQSEAAYQGISYLRTLGKQFEALLPRTKQRKQTQRLLGVGFDGLIGNTVSRYSMHDSSSGVLHKWNRRFFDLNFLNYWTDNHKGAMAELMVSHMGENAHLNWSKVDPDLRRVLGLYDIGDTQWQVIRKSMTRDENGNMFVWPEKVREVTDDAAWKTLLDESDMTDTPRNRERMANELETKLRAYITDRVDHAIPTPGAKEKKWATFGTKAGEPLGVAVRALMMFKMFPTTIMTKIMTRDVYGRGSQSIGHWLMNDRQGKFWMAHTIASTIALGYLSGMIKDTLKGRSPKKVINDDGTINFQTLNDAAFRGGGAGLMGDILLQEYDQGMRGFLSDIAGPVLGQLDPIAAIGTQAIRGKDVTNQASRFFQDNTPFINLFYIRPILDYFVFWNLQEMLEPGSLRRMENRVRDRYGSEYFVSPSKVARD